LRRVRGGSAIQFLRYEMVRIPKLSGSVIGNPCEIAGAWRAEVSRQDWLPYDQNAELCAGMAGEKFFGCGGPPQTSCSCGREQQNDARLVGGGVKEGLKFAQAGESCKGRLACRRFGRSPEIHAREQ
jgi:hypothetical protein